MEPAGPLRGGGADGADVEAWAAASAKLLDLAGDLSGAAAVAEAGAMAETGGGGREAASSLAETLASAFAVMPAAEVGAILLRKLREEARESSRRRESCVPDSGVAGCFGSGMHDDRGEVVVGGGGERRAGSLAGSASSPAAAAAEEVAGVVAHRRGEREEGESVAHAVADACRELVLTCLVGRDERRRGGRGEG